MSPDSDTFKNSGPVHLSSINWSCPHHQRVGLASLVKATYIIEKDSTARRVGPELLAPPWWKHFHFECEKVLRDHDFDKSVWGCIFMFNPLYYQRYPSAPRVVVALRGTLPDGRHIFRDGCLDIRVLFGGINKSTRCQTALDAVQQLILKYKPADIWLAGYSLGASIATVIGKHFAKNNGIHLKTFLFNPPFPTIPPHLFPCIDDNIKDTLYLCKTIFKVGLSLCMTNQHNKSREEFIKLAKWTPYLFVNPQDLISASYIRYFERRKEWEGTLIRGYMEEVAAYTSLREICGDVVVPGSEMPHLLPSATLAVNLNDCVKPHGIHQWWQQDSSLKIDDYVLT